MASIGPQLPPHLQKRKRTPEDDAELGSPPPKASRRGNGDEIPREDDSDDGFGPSAPSRANPDRGQDASRPAPTIGPSLPPTVANSNTAAQATKRQPIGPSLPPTAAPNNSDEIPLDSDDDDDDDTGPAPPPRTTAGPASPPKRVLGPAPPPVPLSERPPTNPDSDSDFDDDWGPALPGSTPNPRTAAGGSGPSTTSTSHAEPAAPKRDDWMLAPPTSSAYRAPDPTKLKARKFASGPRAATEAKTSGISSIWTETPEEKARRLANAVLGREDPNNNSNGPGPTAKPGASSGTASGSGNTKADEARIKAYVEQTRGKSLVAEHQAARAAGKTATLVKGEDARWGKKAGSGGADGEGGANADDEDDDPSKRAFDWEKDMKVGGRISNSQRKELLNRAANFGGRFQSGKYL